MRTASTAFLAALVIAALFWGNCLSCPQARLADAHRCCPKGKQPVNECRTQALQNFEKADPQNVVSPAPAVVEMAAVEAPSPITRTAPTPDTAELYGPPDLLSLHSSFRI
jgi:hypothetical protein